MGPEGAHYQRHFGVASLRLGQYVTVPGMDAIEVPDDDY